MDVSMGFGTLYIYIYKSTTTSRMFQYSKCDPMLTTKILLLTRVILKTFQKKKGDSSLCHASPDIFCFKDKNFEFYNSFPTFWGQKLKFTIHYYYSLSLFMTLFMTLFTPNFCLFKRGCPLYFKQVFSVLSSGLLS